jgi:hypothetical protein
VATARFCGFCSQPNPVAYAFCQRCGKPLPPAAASMPPTALAPSPLEDDGPTERPLTDTERSSLRQSRRARLGNMTRFFGTLMGIVPPFFLLLTLSGVAFDAFNYTIIIIAAAVLALVLGGASLALRAPISVALRAPSVTEVRGVPEKRPDQRGMVAVDLGGVNLLAKPKLADRLLEGQMNEVAFALIGPGGPLHADRARAAIVAVNGEPSAPDAAYVLVPPEVLRTLRPGRRGTFAGKA